MLTAKEARKISKSVGAVNEFEEHVNHCVKVILAEVKKDAGRGYCQHDIDLEDYPKEIRVPIVHKLEDLGYKARPHWFSNIYSISW